MRKSPVLKVSDHLKTFFWGGKYLTINTSWQKPRRGGRGLKKNMNLGARFQKLREGSYYQGGLNSQRGRGKLNSQRGLDSQGVPCFSANVLFLWQHCY